MGSQGTYSTTDVRKGCKEMRHDATWIELNIEVHMFGVDDQDHLQRTEIHADSKRFSVQLPL